MSDALPAASATAEVISGYPSNPKSDPGEITFVVGSTLMNRTSFSETASDLARIIQGCGSNQAIALGALRQDLSSPVNVTAKGRLDQNPGAIARVRDSIDYRPGCPAWVLIDFDSKGMPPDVDARIKAAGGMWNAILTVAPGPPQFEECKHLAECETAESSDLSRYLSHPATQGLGLASSVAAPSSAWRI